MSHKTYYLVMDERAMYNVDDAMVYTVAETMSEALEDAKDFVPCVIVQNNEVVQYVEDTQQ